MIRRGHIAVAVRLDTAIMALEAAALLLSLDKRKRAELDYQINLALDIARRAREVCNVGAPPLSLLKAAE